MHVSVEYEQQYAEALRYAEQALVIYERLRDKDLAHTPQLVARLRAKAGSDSPQ
jgi:hypothetical protein